MIEANIRIVHPGTKLFIRTRSATVFGTDLSPKLLEKACNTLLYRGIAAIIDPHNSERLIVSTNKNIQPVSLKETDWSLDVVDSEEPIKVFRFSNVGEQEIVTALIERRLLAELATRTRMWTIDSQSIWYEEKPFKVNDDIEAYRRFEIGAIPIDEVGVGIIVDVGTAFFSQHNLQYFFDAEQPQHVQHSRQKKFERLTERDKNKKGTLLYTIGNKHIKCYYSDAPQNTTCSTTGSIRINNETYQSLKEYYRQKHPEFDFDPNERAIRVSFANIEQSVWIASSAVRPRIMNDALSYSLRNVDKLNPYERRMKISKFWDKLNHSLGLGMPGLKTGFWQPPEHIVRRLNIPELRYGSGYIQSSPTSKTIEAVKKHYYERLDILSEVGAYYVPPTISRVVHFAFPEQIDLNAAQHFVDGTIEILRVRTKKPLQAAPVIVYSSIKEAVQKLSDEGAEIVVFIMNYEPLAYYNAAHKQNWRVKRITIEVFEKFQRNLRQQTNRKENSPYFQYNSKWERFVLTNALDILQLMDVMPFTLNSMGKYQAQLVIDVAHDRRSFALSLIAYNEKSIAKFLVGTEVYQKGDTQHETINPYILREAIIDLFKKTLGRRFEPIGTLLVLRDGEFREIKKAKHHIKEIQGVHEAIPILQSEKMLASTAEVHLVDFRKDVRKTIRLWEVSSDKTVSNPLEGTTVIINKKIAILATTGSATLHQGTAQPITITGNGHCPDIEAVANSVFDAAQLNWSSPSVAQRFPLGIKDADEELKARDAQQVRQPK